MEDFTVLMIDDYETPEDGQLMSAEYRELRDKVDVLCEMAEEDKLIQPEVILMVFNKDAALKKLLQKHRDDHDRWLARMKEDMYVERK